jgi:hypothetical protein
VTVSHQQVVSRHAERRISERLTACTAASAVHVICMRMMWLVPTAGGVAVGVALGIYARSGNGFLVGPGMLASLAILALVAVIGAGLVVWREHRALGKQLLLFVATTIVMLLSLAVVWPYRLPAGPVPFSRE